MKPVLLHLIASLGLGLRFAELGLGFSQYKHYDTNLDKTIICQNTGMYKCGISHKSLRLVSCDFFLFFPPKIDLEIWGRGGH